MKLEYDEFKELLSMPEGRKFDRKASEYDLRKLANILIAFANADGGTVAIGIKNGRFEGIDHLSNKKINDFQQIGNFIVPVIHVESEFVNIIKDNGKEDRIILLSVLPSEDTLYQNKKDEVYLRLGDETHKVTYDERLSLNDDKNIRKYESQSVDEAFLEDLDDELLKKYSNLMDFKGDNIWKLLFSRGFAKRIRNDDGSFEYRLTVAGVLTFAEIPTAFLPNARIRFIRYEGTEGRLGTEMNVIKQVTVDGPLPKMISKIIEVMDAQLRSFTSLDEATGKFETVPEYPRDAWMEGIVNAVTHRSYSYTGDDIRIIMFDDHLEIHSPGGFPRFINKDNIRSTHYSRNPYIAQALTIFGRVKEFGEGVDRIYKKMADVFLDEPEYESEIDHVTLILKNNIVMRSFRRNEDIKRIIGEKWESLNYVEKRALVIIYEKGSLKTAELQNIANISASVARKALSNLTTLGIFERVASSPTAPNQYYQLVKASKSE